MTLKLYSDIHRYLSFKGGQIEIHSNRNPIDSAFSIYRNLFDTPGMGWAYNQDDLVKYVHLYNDLMLLWQKKLGKYIYECHYERLVTNQEQSVLKTSACVQFEKYG